VKQVIVSTDVAASARILRFLVAEPDDSLALAVLLGAHKKRIINLLGITSTFGNTDGGTVYQICQKQVQLSGLSVPVVKGATRPGQKDSPAVEFIIQKLEDCQGKVILVGLGPVTDFAAVFRLRPDLREKVEGFLLVQSGFLSTNVVRDIGSFAYMQRLGGYHYSLGREKYQIYLNDEQIRQLQAVSHPMMRFITRDLLGWNHQQRCLPIRGYLERKGNMCPWDLAWSMFVVCPGLFTVEQKNGRKELHIKNTKVFHDEMMAGLMKWGH